MRLGGMETIKVDVRIVAATNCDLKEMVDDGRFREDLFYRLNVINVYLPPLRERKEDIPPLAQHFLEKYGAENGKAGHRDHAEALDLLMDYGWPGNVRELENTIERAVVLSSGTSIGADLIPDYIRTAPTFRIPNFVVPPEGLSLKEVITSVERRLIESTLEAAGGVQKRAAELLKIKPTTLNEMIKRHEIDARRKRSSGQAADRCRRPDASGRRATRVARRAELDARASAHFATESGPSSRSKPQHDAVPPVVLLDVAAAVVAQLLAQRRVGGEQLQALHELVAVLVVQPGVGLAAVLDGGGVARAGQHRRADGEAFEH